MVVIVLNRLPLCLNGLQGSHFALFFLLVVVLLQFGLLIELFLMLVSVSILRRWVAILSLHGRLPGYAYSFNLSLGTVWGHRLCIR